MFNQVPIGEDLNKKDLKDNYQWAIARLEDIRDTTTSAEIKDLARIQLKLLKVLKGM